MSKFLPSQRKLTNIVKYQQAIASFDVLYWLQRVSTRLSKLRHVLTGFNDSQLSIKVNCHIFQQLSHQGRPSSFTTNLRQGCTFG